MAPDKLRRALCVVGSNGFADARAFADATICGDRGLVYLLLEAWPDCVKSKVKDDNRDYPITPLHHASENGHADLVADFLKVWPDGAKAKCDNGDIPLHYARDADTVTALLKAWPDGAKAKDDNGDTPLHCASENGHADAVTALLKAWPDGAKDKNYDGCIPLQLASEQGHADAVAALLKAWPEGPEQYVTSHAVDTDDECSACMAAFAAFAAQMSCTAPDMAAAVPPAEHTPGSWALFYCECGRLRVFALSTRWVVNETIRCASDFAPWGFVADRYAGAELRP